MECFVMPIYNCVGLGSALTGPSGPISAGIFAVLGNFRINFWMFSVSESVIVRFLVIKVWKRPPPLDEDFFAFFAQVFNYTLCAFYALIMYMTNDQLSQQWLLMGKNPDEIPSDLLRFRITGFLILVTSALMVALVSRSSSTTLEMSSRSKKM